MESFVFMFADIFTAMTVQLRTLQTLESLVWLRMRSKYPISQIYSGIIPPYAIEFSSIVNLAGSAFHVQNEYTYIVQRIFNQSDKQSNI